MNLSKIFKGKSILASSKVNSKYLEKLRQEAELHQNKWRSDWKLADRLYEGDKVSMENIGGALTSEGYMIDRNGNPVHGSISDLDTQINTQTDQYRRYIKLIKTYIETHVAKYCEVDPYAIAERVNRFDTGKEIALVVKKINILLDNFLTKENNFDQIYENIVRSAMKYNHTFAEICLEEDKGFTSIPFKIKSINPAELWIDPFATTIKDAEYIYRKFSMRLEDMKEQFVVPDELLNKGSDKIEEVLDTDICEIVKYWIRIKNRKVGKTKWLCIYTYQNEWLLKKFTEKDEYGNIISERAETDKSFYMYPALPLVIFRTHLTDKWYGAISLALDSADSQLEYNETKTDEKLNWKKSINPSTRGNIAGDKINKEPGGHTPMGSQDNFVYDKTETLPQATIQYRADSIKKEMDLVFGNTELMEGNRLEGVYNNAYMQTMMRINEIKPRRIEGLFLDSIKELCIAYLEILNSWILSSGISMVDYETGGTVTIYPDDIVNTQYTIDIKIKDMNLLSPEKKVEMINQIMQYNPKLQETFPMYYKVLMYNNSMPNLFPARMIADLENDYETQTELKKMEYKTRKEELKVAYMDLLIKEDASKKQLETAGIVYDINDKIKTSDEEDIDLEEDTVSETEYESRVSILLKVLENNGADEAVIGQFIEIANNYIDEGIKRQEAIFELENKVVGSFINVLAKNLQSQNTGVQKDNAEFNLQAQSQEQLPNEGLQEAPQAPVNQPAQNPLPQSPIK